VSQQPSTEEIEGGTSQSFQKKLLAICQEPEESGHLKPVNNMATTGNKPFCLCLPSFERFPTSQLPLKAEKVSRPRSVFTSYTVDTSSVLYGIMSSLLEGCVHEKSLTYPINDLSF